MLNEQLEFQISQYADGSLPRAEVAALEAVLAADADARALLAEYRSLDAALKRELPVPAINYDRLAEHLSAAVAAEDERAAAADRPITLTISRWWVRSAAIAAVVLLAVGSVAIWSNRRGAAPTETVAINSGSTPDAGSAVAVVEISGPAAEVAAGPAVSEISIDATPLAKQTNFGAAETIVYRAPRVVIASGPPTRQDVPTLPY